MNSPVGGPDHEATDLTRERQRKTEPAGTALCGKSHRERRYRQFLEGECKDGT